MRSQPLGEQLTPFAYVATRGRAGLPEFAGQMLKVLFADHRLHSGEHRAQCPLGQRFCVGAVSLQTTRSAGLRFAERQGRGLPRDRRQQRLLALRFV